MTQLRRVGGRFRGVFVGFPSSGMGSHSQSHSAEGEGTVAVPESAVEFVGSRGTRLVVVCQSAKAEAFQDSVVGTKRWHLHVGEIVWMVLRGWSDRRYSGKMERHFALRHSASGGSFVVVDSETGQD